MPFGARPTWLVGHKARVGRFGQRECDRRFRGGAAGAPACYRRADPARFRAARRRVSARRRCPPAPGGAVRSRRRQRTHSRAADPPKPRLTAGVIWRDHALKIFGTAVLLSVADFGVGDHCRPGVRATGTCSAEQRGLINFDCFSNQRPH